MKRLLIFIFTVSLSLSIFPQNAQWLIKPEYDAIADFSEGIVAVKRNGKWGYVNDKGEIIVPCEYEIAYPYSDGMGVLALSDNTLVAITDLNGNITPITTKLKVDNRFAEFSDGLLLVTDGRKWGYLNKSGQLSIECKYLFALPFSEGLAGVRFDYNGDWYYIAPNGSTMIYPGFQGRKKDIYWALGFRNGKALIVYGNGLGHIDNTGKELNEKTPKFSPPNDPASYKRSTLQSKEGDLIFDSKGCVVSFESKKEGTVNFVPAEDEITPGNSFILNGAIVKDNIRWQANNHAIVNLSGKYGVVQVNTKPPIAFTSSNQVIESVFGNPAILNYIVQNISGQDIDNLLLRSEDNTLVENLSIPKNQQQELTIRIDKSDDAKEENRTLKITAEERGLLLGNYELNFRIIDKPSIALSLSEKKIEIDNSSRSYPLEVVVENLSGIEGKSTRVIVNQQTKEVSLLPKSKNALKFDIPVHETDIHIAVKPLNTPPVILSEKVALIVKAKEKQAVKQEENSGGIGNTKRETEN